ncbi:MAG: RNA polymerase sigma factor [Jatrophihabitans sp.]|uniref:RNA polymerase sigma factor n=1 Tax=Jatrophihabitans sp. TaxID=1932789 RepID=UPI003F811AFA
MLTDETVEDRAWLCSAEDCVVAEFDRREVVAAIRHLTPVQRECIALRFLAGCTLEETAEYTGSNVGSVKAAQHRGLRSLRQLLAASCRGADQAQPVDGCVLAEAAA